MEDNNSFTEEDFFTNDLICRNFIKDFNRSLFLNIDRNVLVTSDAAVASRLHLFR